MNTSVLNHDKSIISKSVARKIAKQFAQMERDEWETFTYGGAKLLLEDLKTSTLVEALYDGQSVCISTYPEGVKTVNKNRIGLRTFRSVKEFYAEYKLPGF